MENRGVNSIVGFQLIEIVVSGSIFFLLAIFVLNLMPTSQLATKKAESRLAAEGLAHSTLERLRGGSFDNLINGPIPNREEELNNVTFRISVSVNDIPDSNPDLIREVVVETVWDEPGGAKTVTASSYVSRIKK